LFRLLFTTLAPPGIAAFGRFYRHPMVSVMLTFTGDGQLSGMIQPPATGFLQAAPDLVLWQLLSPTGSKHARLA